MTQISRRTDRLLYALLLATVALAGCSQGAPAGGAPPPPEVAVVTAEAGSLPMTLEYTGQTAGSRDVEVRARVSGILLQRRYQEGSAVRQGDVLFQIDPEPYRAAAAEARAEVGVERAKLNEARRQHDRILPLFDKGLVSQMNRDEAISNYEVAAANVAAAEAKLRKANLDLGYTEVRAPIGGLTSHEARSEGSLVTAGAESSLLTRIVQTDPIYVEFSLPEADAMALRPRLKARDSGVTVRLLLESGETYPTGASINFLDTSVQSGTGTLRARATLANADGNLLPGQFVRVRLEGVTLQGVAVPRRAVMSSAQGTFVWVVGAGDKVELRPVKLGGNVGERELITTGLQGGERVVVEGVLKVQPGVQVTIAKPAPAAAAGPAQ
ncbi:MAG TPA: efflux RND transporter periplasmic adaptor subunit [Steroidobacteraceae bacterium]